MKKLNLKYNECIAEDIKDYLRYSDEEMDVTLIADYECVRSVVEDLISEGMVTIESIKLEPYYANYYDGPWYMSINYYEGLLFCQEAVNDGKYVLICHEKVFLQEKYIKAMDGFEDCDITLFSCYDEETKETVKDDERIENGIHFHIHEKDGKLHGLEYKDDNTYASFASSSPISSAKADEFIDIISKYFR